jgi:hypothetical protein
LQVAGFRLQPARMNFRSDGVSGRFPTPVSENVALHAHYSHSCIHIFMHLLIHKFTHLRINAFSYILKLCTLYLFSPEQDFILRDKQVNFKSPAEPPQLSTLNLKLSTSSSLPRTPHPVRQLAVCPALDGPGCGAE